jgi:hypothetical protein
MSILKKKPSIKDIEGFIKSQKALPHMTFVSILIGVGISAVTLLVIATLDGSLFGQEAEAAYRGKRTRNSIRSTF